MQKLALFLTIFRKTLFKALGILFLISICQSFGFSFFAFHQDTPPRNLWQAMAQKFQLLPRTYPNALQRNIQMFVEHPYYVTELVNNAGPYIYYVYQQTQKQHMPAEIALIPMIESNYNPFVYSHAGATGLWQMMPGTASGYGLSINWWYDGRRDVISSTKAALDYLEYLYNFFNQNWLLAMAAYDSGEGTVQSAILHNKKHHLPTDYWSLSLPKETKSYIPKILALAAIIQAPHHYGLNWPSVANQPYFAIIPMESQIDLKQAAKLAGVDPQLVRELNPGFRRFATLPDEFYNFLLPVNKARGFVKALDQIPLSSRVTWRHHQVISGETLSEIAWHYHTRVAILKQINHLKRHIIRIGQSLLVPFGASGNFNHLSLNLQHDMITEDDLPGPRHATHKVNASDNLWTIAAHYGVTVNELRYWNKLGYRQTIHPGQKLTIWLPPRTDPKILYDNYTVKPGNSLSIIAQRYHTSVKAIKKASKLTTDLIRIGEVLTIPVKIRQARHHHPHRTKHSVMRVVIVKSGDTLSTIAARYGLSSHDLIRWNHHLDLKKIIKPGEKIRIDKLKRQST